MHFVTGNVSEQVLVNSFILPLDQKEGDLVNGEGPSCSNAVPDILEDYSLNAVVNKVNTFDIVVKASKNAFLRYLCFTFQKLCEVMEKPWEGCGTPDINKIYESALPTQETLLEVCEIDENESQEAKCATWFCRYIRCCTSRMLQLLLQFSTDSVQTQRLKSRGIPMSGK